MSKTRNHTAAHVGIILGSLVVHICAFSTTAMAQEAVPLQVLFEIEKGKSLERAWGSALIEKIEKALTERWASKLAERFQYWDLKRSPAHPFGTVTLRVHEPEKNKIRITMVWKQRRAQREEEVWSKVWLDASDFTLGLRPPSDKAKQALLDKAEVFFGDSEEQNLKEVLLKVPLGYKGVWTKKDPRHAITSLRWSRFNALVNATVRLVVKSNRRVNVVGRVMGSAGSFQPTPTESAYDAIVVDPFKTDDGKIGGLDASAVAASKIGQIFLVEEGEDLDDEFFEVADSNR